MTVKTALVTGGNSGIGLGITEALIKNGYEVTIIGRSSDSLLAAQQSLGCKTIQMDLNAVENFEDIAKEFENDGLSLLVNNAGVAPNIPIGNYNQTIIESTFKTNTFTPLLLIQALIPSLSKNKGSVINISSAAATKGLPGAALYGATKAALESITRSLAIELAPLKVRVNAIAPGAIDTPIFSKMGIPEEHLADVKNMVMSTIPLGEFGAVNNIAGAVLSMSQNDYVTGSIWSVDGGATAT